MSLNNSSESIQAIQEAFSMAGSDATNITAMIVEAADVERLRAAKIQAIENKLNLCCTPDEDGNSGGFLITHKGVKVLIDRIEENDDSGGYHRSGQFWAPDEFAALTIVDKPTTTPHHAHYIIRPTANELATTIFNLMDDQRYCYLCSQLFEGMVGYNVCTECMLSELPKPCATCGKIVGRDMNLLSELEHTEHPGCYGRRTKN
jgi:hypothetical protein